MQRYREEYPEGRFTTIDPITTFCGAAFTSAFSIDCLAVAAGVVGEVIPTTSLSSRIFIGALATSSTGVILTALALTALGAHLCARIDKKVHPVSNRCGLAFGVVASLALGALIHSHAMPINEQRQATLPVKNGTHTP